ncbi:MAG: diacylglycerol kinase family protein [Eggerthellaceae bacterium]|jgi:undecaprenol kinase
MKPEHDFGKSFGYAFRGIVTAWRKGYNLRVQSAAGVLAVVLGLAFGISLVEWCAVVVCIGAVIGGECMNTALEDAVDLANPEVHPLAKSAKDMAAGAVLVMSIASAVIGIIIFLPRILSALGV